MERRTGSSWAKPEPANAEHPLHRHRKLPPSRPRSLRLPQGRPLTPPLHEHRPGRRHHPRRTRRPISKSRHKRHSISLRRLSLQRALRVTLTIDELLRGLLVATFHARRHRADRLSLAVQQQPLEMPPAPVPPLDAVQLRGKSLYEPSKIILQPLHLLRGHAETEFSPLSSENTNGVVLDI